MILLYLIDVESNVEDSISKMLLLLLLPYRIHGKGSTVTGQKTSQGPDHRSYIEKKPPKSKRRKEFVTE